MLDRHKGWLYNLYMMTQTQTTKLTFDKLADALCEPMANLAGRWLDESEYEDINEYGEVLDPILDSLGMTRRSMTKRPFGVVARYHAGGYVLRITMSASGTFKAKKVH